MDAIGQTVSQENNKMPAKSKKRQAYFGYLLNNPQARKEAGVTLKEAKKMAKKPKGGYKK